MTSTFYLGLKNSCYGFKKSDCGTQVQITYQELGHSEFVEIDRWVSPVEAARSFYKNLVADGASQWGAFSS